MLEGISSCVLSLLFYYLISLLLFSIQYDSMKSETECTIPEMTKSKPLLIEKESKFKSRKLDVEY